jgi:hypothetical protein
VTFCDFLWEKKSNRGWGIKSEYHVLESMLKTNAANKDYPPFGVWHGAFWHGTQLPDRLPRMLPNKYGGGPLKRQKQSRLDEQFDGFYGLCAGSADIRHSSG